MAINFNNIGSNQVKPDEGLRTPGQGLKDSSRVSPGVDSRESVRLSDTAQKLPALAQNIKDASALDHDKVDAIRKAIAEGDYHIDAARLATNILEMESQLNT